VRIISAGDAPSRARKIVHKGDVLYSCVGPYLRNVAIVESDFDPSPIVSTAFAVLNGGDYVVPEYEWIVLRSPWFVSLVEKKMRGQAYPAINDSDFSVLPFPVPPLAEQHRIANKVNELMALCDKVEVVQLLRSTLQRQLTSSIATELTKHAQGAAAFTDKARLAISRFSEMTHKREQVQLLREAIVALGIQGRLVLQDDDDEPAAQLMDRITLGLDSRSRGLLDTRLPEHPNPLPLNWVTVPLITLGSWARGAAFPESEQGKHDREYFFLKISDMNLPGNDKFIITANNTIDADTAKRIKAALHPAGTIIFPKIGGAIATNKRRILTRPSAIDNNCLGITFAAELDLEWAYLVMTALDLTRYQAGTAVPALQQSVLGQIAIGVPPAAEQRRIASRVNELMNLCSKLEVSLMDAAKLRRDLLDGVIAEALAARQFPAPSSVSC